jgi:hypothetical protein
MPHVETRPAVLGGRVLAVLRKVGIARACEETGRIVRGFTVGVDGKEREAAIQPLLKLELQRVVLRRAAGFDERDEARSDSFEGTGSEALPAEHPETGRKD